MPYLNAVGQVGKVKKNGTVLEGKDEISLPYELRFTFPGNDELYASWDTKEIDPVSGKQVMWYDQLRDALKGGDLLMNVETLTAPLSLNGSWEKIGKIELISDLYTSDFGDNRLFFEHYDGKKDKKYWPKTW